MAGSYVQKLRLFKRDVLLYLVAAALCGFAMDGINAVLQNLYLLRLGYGPEFIGLANAAAALVFTAGCLPAGLFGTRWGSRRMMIVGLSLLAAGLGSVTVVEFIPAAWWEGWLLATSSLSGLGLALFFVNGIPFLMAVTGPEERDYAFAVHLALGPLAAFAGSLLAGALPSALAAVLNVAPSAPGPYRVALLSGALALVPAAIALVPTREVRAAQSQEPEPRGERAPFGVIGLIGLLVLLRFAGLGATNTFFNVYLDSGLGSSTALIGGLSAVRGLVSVPGALVAPLFMARWGKRRAIVWGSLGGAFSLLPLALVPHWGAAGLGAAGVSALGGFAGAPFRVFTQELVAPRWRAAASAVLMMGAGLSVAAMAFCGGHLISAVGYSGLFLTSAGLMVVGTVIFWAVFCVAVEKPARLEAVQQAG